MGAHVAALEYASVARGIEEGREVIGALDARLRAWSWGACDDIIGDQRQDPV